MLLAAGPSAHESKGPNGGRIADAGSYHVELVVSGAQVDVFVSDSNDKAVATGRIQSRRDSQCGREGAAHCAGIRGPELSGKAGSDLPANVKGVVQLTAPDGKVAQGQFK